MLVASSYLHGLYRERLDRCIPGRTGSRLVASCHGPEVADYWKRLSIPILGIRAVSLVYRLQSISDCYFIPFHGTHPTLASSSQAVACHLRCCPA